MTKFHVRHFPSHEKEDQPNKMPGEETLDELYWRIAMWNPQTERPHYVSVPKDEAPTREDAEAMARLLHPTHEVRRPMR